MSSMPTSMSLTPRTRSSTGFDTSRTSRVAMNSVPETSKLIAPPKAAAQRPPAVVAFCGPSPSWPGLMSLLPPKTAHSVEYSM